MNPSQRLGNEGLISIAYIGGSCRLQNNLMSSQLFEVILAGRT